MDDNSNSGQQQDLLSAALDECGLGDFFANPIVQDDLTNSLPPSPSSSNVSTVTSFANQFQTEQITGNNDYGQLNQQQITPILIQPQQTNDDIINVATTTNTNVSVTIPNAHSVISSTTTNHSIQQNKQLKIKRYVIKKVPSSSVGTVVNGNTSLIASSSNNNVIRPKILTISSPSVFNSTNGGGNVTKLQSTLPTNLNVILNDISNKSLVNADSLANVKLISSSGTIAPTTTITSIQQQPQLQIVNSGDHNSGMRIAVQKLQHIQQSSSSMLSSIVSEHKNVIKVRLQQPNNINNSAPHQPLLLPIVRPNVTAENVVDNSKVYVTAPQPRVRLLDQQQIQKIVNCQPKGNGPLTPKSAPPTARVNFSINDRGISLISSAKSVLKSASMDDKDELEKSIMLSEEMRRLLEEHDDELANLETFAEYRPAKLNMGLRHPDQVVETSSLSSIPPPDIYYRLRIPDEVVDDGRLSALQLESIIYASQQHENYLADGSRAGFLIGDGAGVGKGRTVAGIIYENYLHGRKRALWFSVSTDLKYDAERDLHDIGANRIEVHLLNKFKYGFKIHSPENDNVKRGIIFATYNSLIGESTSISGRFSTRFQQILQWCGEDFDGVIIFDECHKAKNLFPNGSTRATKTGQAVLDLQRCLPKARVVYASATGATEPKNMGYMTRLGIWGPGTPFEDFNQFVSMVEKRGVGAMELVAIDLKMRGMYMARQLSFKGVHFRIEHVPLSREFIRIYNCCCRLWVSAKTKFEKALELMEADPQVSKAIWTQFWASHQRFFKYLCIASKVKFAVAFVKEALRCDKAVVIGLQSTGEARTLEQLEENGGELNDFVSTAKSVFQSLVERHFPAPNRKKLAKLLGQDTSFFDDLGIKLKRNANDEIVVCDDDEDQINKRPSGQNFFDSDEDDDDFIEVQDEDLEIASNNSSSSSKNSDSDSDIDSDDLDQFDDLMDQKLGLKPGAKPSASMKFMDILLGPSTTNRKRKRKVLQKRRQKKKIKLQHRKRPLKNKYEKYYNGFDNVGSDVGGYCEQLKCELLEQLESFGERLPPNTLDELIDELGGPEMVAEMTGRKGRIVSTEDGQVQYEARTENDVSLEMLNLVEKQRFMDDEKRVAIISEAASSGISLHADRRAQNRCRRVHLTVELPWSADRAIQQFGRTHRSNQVSAPEYVFLISKLAGEKRFASIVAKRLESLGALTHGDRRAAESRDLSQFNIDTKYGRQALEIIMKCISGQNQPDPNVQAPEMYSGDFFEDCREGLAGVGLLNIDRKTGTVSLDKDYANINKFLNRILGLEVELQNSLFRYFNETMDSVIKQAKRHGRYDSGIIDLSSEVGNVQRLNQENFILKSASGAIKIQLHTVSIDRGLNYERALNMYKQAKQEDDYFKEEIGFYTSNSTYQIRKTIFLAIPENPNKNKDVKQIFRIYKPSLGLQAKYETKTSLKERGYKLDDLEQAEKLWQEHYEKSEQECTHQLLFGRCRTQQQLSMSNKLTKCDTGIRKRTYCVLSGAVLTVWPEIEKSIPYIQTHKLQIVRLKTEDNFKYIGPMIPPMCVEEVRECLKRLENGPPSSSINPSS